MRETGSGNGRVGDHGRWQTFRGKKMAENPEYAIRHKP